jgi:hypothetical protein
MFGNVSGVSVLQTEGKYIIINECDINQIKVLEFLEAL